MARKASARVVLNRSRLTDVGLAIADGVAELGRTIVEVAAEQAPDSPYDPYPTGEGLPKQGGVLVYVGGEKVHGWSQRGGQPGKPRALRAKVRGSSVLMVAGFGFPGRFAELGTIDTPAQPFLSPASAEVLPHAADIIGTISRPKIGGRD